MRTIRDAIVERWPLLVILATAAIWFYRSPYNASDLEIVPDSEEYAIGGLELLETGHFHLTIEGRQMPPRYPPWFSAAVIIPAYVLFGHEPGNAVLPVTAIAIAGVGFAWATGRRVNGTAGGIFAALAVLIVPSYSIRAGQIMTDVPCAALTIAVCLLYQRTRARPDSLAPLVTAGVLIALTCLFRTLFATLLLPFLYDTLRLRSGRIRRLLALGLPLSLAAAATFAYNAVTFGSPFRNGYHFWTPVPSDYLWLTFSVSNIGPNITALRATPLGVLLGVAIGAWLFLRFRRSELLSQVAAPLRDLLRFFALAVTPLCAIHLLYFYRSDRFFLPLLVGSAIMAGVMASLALGRRAPAIAKVIAIAALLLSLVGRFANPDATPHRRLAADRIRNFTPDNATVISTAEPVYMQRLAAHRSHRRIIPLSRNVEYASKLVAWKRIPNPQPPPLNARDSRCPGLINGGAEEAVKFVASEHLDEIAQEVTRGTPIFVDTTFADAASNEVLTQLSQRCALLRRAPYLYQVLPR